MEDSGGVIGRRITLLEQMSAVQDRRDSLAGLTLDAILANKRPLPQPQPPPPSGRTLLDIIRDDDTSGKTFGPKDRKSWKLFRDRLRLKRAGAAWTSSVDVPTSDLPIPSASLNISNPRSQLSRRSSVRFQANPAGELTTQLEDSVSTNNRGPPPQFTRRCSSRVSSSSPMLTESTHHEDSPDSPHGSPSSSSRPQFSRYNSTRIVASNPETEENSADPFEVAREGTRRLAVALAQERALSAREAVAAQEAAEAEAASVAEAEGEASVQAAPEEVTEQAPAPRMSLMDLLEETDREMGVEGSRYTVGDDEEEEEEEEEGEDEEEGDDVEENAGGIEHNCCVCMVRHKGAAFIPCGHTFCRLCSRELWVQRGSCPLCNGFILEILDIF